MSQAEPGRMALVRTTVADRADADRMARDLVGRGLAACVHLQETTSTYSWKGALHTEREWLVEARALEEQASAVREALLAGHPYEVPLVEVLQVTGVPARYLAWAKG